MSPHRHIDEPLRELFGLARQQLLCQQRGPVSAAGRPTRRVAAYAFVKLSFFGAGFRFVHHRYTNRYNAQYSSGRTERFQPGI